MQKELIENIWVEVSTFSEQSANDASLKLPLSITIPFGILFLFLMILCWWLSPKMYKKVEEYKKLQLEKYKKENRIKGDISYEKTKMYLPWTEIFKKTIFPILSVVCLVLAITFLAGTNLSTNPF